MILHKRAIFSFLIFLALVALLSILYFSTDHIPNDQKQSKEYIYHQHVSALQNPVSLLLSKVDHQLAQVFSFDAETILLPIPFKMQEHPLSCEVAALGMSLNYLGVQVNEEDLLQKLPHSTTEARSVDNVWGDPQLGFVGDIDGSVFFGTGYGVYNQPIKKLALNYRGAGVLKKPTLQKVLQFAQHGKPVIVWGLLTSKEATYWFTQDWRGIKAFPGEHARIVMGYTGTISNPTGIILMDPLYGKITLNTEQFLTEWAMLDNMNVVII